MKNLMLIFSFILLTVQLQGQDFSKLLTDDLNGAEACKKAEKQVVECCNYLYSNSLKTDADNRQKAIQFVFKWMEATPDFTFDIDENVMTLTGGDKELLSLYLAAMAQTAIEMGKENMNKVTLAEKTETKFLTYCNNSDNGVKPNKEIKRRLREMNGVEV